MGRFQSPDSLMGSPENPQSWNLYSYVQNNPVTNTDPDGHDCVVQTRTSSTTETVSVSSGTCDGVSVGDGQSKSYIAGTVDTSSITANSSGGISLSYTPYATTDGTGANLGVASLSAAPIPDNPGLAYGYGNNAQGYQQLSNASQVVKAGTVAYAAAYGGVACYFACPAGAAAVGRWGLQRLAMGATSPALLNLINRLYQAQDEIPGGTAGAVRNEVATGEFINGGHAIKAQEMITALTKLINSGELSGSDQMIAGHIISDLKNSLGK
jgi:hypothetical protein